MLAAAERAASTGDLVSAEELLKNAAQLQEKELGPSHPELANTLNNLAIVAETAGRLDDAETLYRRAVAITSTSLPPDDPMVAASRRNLDDFCRAHDRTVPRPAVTAPVSTPPAPPLAPAAAPPSALATTHKPGHAPARAVVSKPAPAPKPADSQPPPTASRPSSRAPAMIAIGVLALVILMLLITRPWSERRAPAPSPAADAPRERAPSAEPAPPAPVAVSPGDRSPAPKVDKTTAPDAVVLVAAQLCRSLSTSDWRCAPAGDSVAPGPMVLYTRVRSPRDGVIVHRWYRGDALLKSAQLRVGANASEGYRTYSRQAVDAGDWRVEVRSAAGDLLHEQRFAVR
jgi:hypothetical protein